MPAAGAQAGTGGVPRSPILRFGPCPPHAHLLSVVLHQRLHIALLLPPLLRRRVLGGLACCVGLLRCRLGCAQLLPELCELGLQQGAAGQGPQQ